MDWPLTIAALNFTAAAMALGAAAWMHAAAPMPGRGAFVMTQLAIAWWAGTASLEIAFTDPDLRLQVGQLQALLRICAQRVPLRALAGHFHDTYGHALTNVYAALELVVATFDCARGGSRRMPYAKGATGNVASEDVLYLLEGLNIETGVDMTRLRHAGQYISDFLQRPPVSRVARALAAKSPLAA